MNEQDIFDREIIALLKEMEKTDKRSNAYKGMCEALAQLMKGRDSYKRSLSSQHELDCSNSDAMKEWIRKSDPNTLLGCLTSIGMMFMILNYEESNILKSKAFTIIPKIKLF